MKIILHYPEGPNVILRVFREGKNKKKGEMAVEVDLE